MEGCYGQPLSLFLNSLSPPRPAGILVTYLAVARSGLFTGLPNHPWEKEACCTPGVSEGARGLAHPAPASTGPAHRLMSPHVHQANQHQGHLSTYLASDSAANWAGTGRVHSSCSPNSGNLHPSSDKISLSTFLSRPLCSGKAAA